MLIRLTAALQGNRFRMLFANNSNAKAGESAVHTGGQSTRGALFLEMCADRPLLLSILCRFAVLPWSLCAAASRWQVPPRHHPQDAAADAWPWGQPGGACQL